MTEAEWLVVTDPIPMLEFLRYYGRNRQERLLGCAVCRRMWHQINDARCRRAVEASERYADGEISYSALDMQSGEAQEAFEEASWGDSEINGDVAYAVSYTSNPDLTIDLLGEALIVASTVSKIGLISEQKAQSSLIRDIFHNIVRPIPFAPKWRTDTVRTLASQMYDSRDFAAMPILADALQDAGCDSDDILNHCRGLGPHVRGCWVVDLVLGKG